MAGLFVVTLLLILFVQGLDIRAMIDQDDYHYIAIASFAADWPASDFSDYPSATTPGYHWFVAAWGTDKTTLRIVGSFFGIALIALLGWAVARRTPPNEMNGRAAWIGPVLLCLPLAWSPYVVSSSLWLLPDDAAWLGVLLLLLLIWRDRPWSMAQIIAAGVILLVLVWFRQIHLWLAGGLWASAWVFGMQSDGSKRLSTTVGMIVVTLPAMGLIGGFMLLWGGASPPSMQSHVTGPNPAVGANVLSLLGIYSVFFVGWLVSGMRRMVSREGGWCLLRRCLFAGLVVGFVLGIVPQTDWATPQRVSGLWNIARHLPTFADRSPLIIALSAFGGLTAGAWFAALWANGSESSRRAARLWLVVMLLFVLANTAAAHAWQRYYEPFLLMMLALTAVMIMRVASLHDEKSSPWRWGGPGVLAVLQIANLVRVMS